LQTIEYMVVNGQAGSRKSGFRRGWGTDRGGYGPGTCLTGAKKKGIFFAIRFVSALRNSHIRLDLRPLLIVRLLTVIFCNAQVGDAGGRL